MPGKALLRGILTLLTLIAVAPLSAQPMAEGLGTSGAVSSFGWWSPDFTRWTWHERNPNASWEARAGLQVVKVRGRLYLMGGRAPIPAPFPGASQIFGDVWTSSDWGKNWELLVPQGSPDLWPARAYFQALSRGQHMFVLGGQNFKFGPECPPETPVCSDFFSDVWRSSNGVDWTRLTADAGWEGRAGLSAVVHRGALYVLGGSRNDDDAIIGPGGPPREYFNDVWKSYNGRDWFQVTDDAPWAARAGAVVVSKGRYLYLLGGEDGFLCTPATERCPPYYNDVWRSRNGRHWELVTMSAGWSPRPGHQCVVVYRDFVCFGGFGVSDDPLDPFKPSNPMDVWVSQDGAEWTQVSDSPWNAESPEDIKYDFDALVVYNKYWRPSILTFGGDRETFDFSDPQNLFRVDNDVWRFMPPRR